MVLAAIFFLGLTLLGAYVYSTKSVAPSYETNPTAEVETYVRKNITALSPEHAVLGGTFYVTDIRIDPSTQTGTVWYEDGHIALVAHFKYVQSRNNGYEITSFIIGDR